MPGTVAVNSTPPGAAIWYSNGTDPLIDSSQVTPFTLGGVAAGTYNIALRKAGYQEWTQTQTLPPGGSITFSATLVALTGTVAINSTPPGAAIWYSIGTGPLTDSGQVTPFTLGGVAAGTYNIALRKAGYAEWTQTQTLPPGGSISFNATLTPFLVLTSIAPDTLTAGQPFTLTFTGTGFQPGAVLVISPGSIHAPLDFVSPTELKISGVLPLAPPGQYALQILNPDSQLSNALFLQVLPPPPPAAVEADFNLTGRNIRQVKKGHNMEHLRSPYAVGLYAREIGYEDGFVRLHDYYTMPYWNGRISERIEAVQKFGKPTLMLTIWGMPRELSRYEDYDFSDGACPRPWATAPPKDWIAWKNYVRDLVRYVNFEKGYGVKYFEIWNEPIGAVPDDRVGGLLGCFWSGTEQEYYTLYQKTVEGIREAYAPDPVPADVRIGGPATAGWNERFQPQGEPLYVTLPRFAQQNSLPLDFYSWHQYSGNPGEIEAHQVTATIRGALASFGFANVELNLNEYEVSWPAQTWANHKRSVLLAGTFATAVNQGVDRQSMHALEDVPGAVHGLFGGPGNLIAKPEFNLYKGIELLGNQLIPLARPYHGSVFALATKSSDRVGVMLVNFSDQPLSDIQLRLSNLPATLNRHTRFLIDANHSNAYAIAARIQERMNLAETQAGSAAKDRFTLFLRHRGYGDAEINTALTYIARYLANPDDPEVKSFLDSLSPKQRRDLIDAFNAAMALHTAVLHQAAEEVNHWTEVKLYSESKPVSPATGEYTESVALPPYSVQFILLSDKELVDQVAPTVAITSPKDGETVTGTVTVAASASDDREVRMVEFYMDGAVVGFSAAPPYELVWYSTTTFAGPHTLTARAYDAAGNSTSQSVLFQVGLDAAALVVNGLMRSTQAVVGPSGGTVGDIQATGAQVSIPPGTISSSQTVSVSTIATSGIQDSQAVGLGLSPAGPPMDIHIVGQENGSQFSQLVTITLGYDAAQVGNPGLLTMRWWDEPAGTWRTVPQVQVDPSSHTVTARVNHFTLFRVFEAAPKAADAWSLGEVFAFPNPATSGKVTIHAEAGKADQVEIRIYDVAGALVHRAELSGPPGIGVNGREAFQYAWNASGAASGIYLYSVRAMKGNQSATTARKLAVVR